MGLSRILRFALALLLIGCIAGCKYVDNNSATTLTPSPSNAPASSGASTFTIDVADSASSPVASQIVISGAGIKGPLAFATVNIYELDTSQAGFYNPASPIAAASTNANAAIENLVVYRPATSLPFVMVIDGTNAIDLNTNTAPVVTVLKTVITQSMVNAGRPVYATPLTTLAFEIAALETGAGAATTGFEQAMDYASKLIGSTIGMGLPREINILTAPPIINQFTTTPEQQQLVAQYRALVEAFSAIVYRMSLDTLNTASPVNTNDMIKRLARDLQSDGVINNSASGVAIGGINTSLLTQDLLSVNIANSDFLVRDIVDVLAMDMNVVGISNILYRDSISLSPMRGMLNSDIDGDGILNINDVMPATSVASNSVDDPVQWSLQIANAGGYHHFVTTAAEFNAASAAARPGDVIVIADGVYSWWKLTISSNGTADKPVIYTAQTPGQVTFTGIYNNGLVVRGDHNLIGGFRFENCGAYFVRFIQASDNRFTDSAFKSCGEGAVNRIVEVTDHSDRNRLDHLTMEDSHSIGIGIYLPTASDTFGYSMDTRIDHNVFKNIVRDNSAQGQEPIQIGHDFHGPTRTVVEYNEWDNVPVQSISSKSDDQIIRYNRFINSGGLMLRTGNNKIVEGNYFEGSGIQVWGSNHRIVNNVIINGGITIPCWGSWDGGDGKIYSAEPTGNNLIAYNTIVGSNDYAIEYGRTWGYGDGYLNATNLPFNNRFINNILVSGQGVLFGLRNSLADNYVSNNLYFAQGSATPGYLGGNSLQGDPLLNSDYSLAAGSIARDRATILPEVTIDINGILRTSPDLGAFEG